MYQIIRIADNTELAVTDTLLYVRKTKHGTYAPASEAEAQGVSVCGVVYSLSGREALDGAEPVTINQVDGGAFVQQTKQNATDSADLLDLSVDHEYRLTMLELGPTDL